MCYINRKIYTVCAHCKEEGPFECQAQKKRIERWQYDDGFCVNLGISLSRCWPPVKLTELIYGFCDECCSFYRGQETRRVSVILNYWASRGYSESVPAGSISAGMVFSNLSLEHLKRPRCEFVALAKVLPRRLSEPFGQWLQRLEGVRKSTLEWAEYGPPPRARHQRTVNQDAVNVQPPVVPPMSAYPYGEVPDFAPGLSQALENVATALPPNGNRTSPQFHLETLHKLCGDVPHGFPSHPRREPSQPQQNTLNADMANTRSRAPHRKALPTRHLTPPPTRQTTPQPPRHPTRAEAENQQLFIHLKGFPFQESGCAIMTPHAASAEGFTDVDLGAPPAAQLDSPNEFPVFGRAKEEEEEEAETPHRPFSSEPIKPPEVSAPAPESCLTGDKGAELNDANMTSRFSVSDDGSDCDSDAMSLFTVSELGLDGDDSAEMAHPAVTSSIEKEFPKDNTGSAELRRADGCKSVTVLENPNVVAPRPERRSLPRFDGDGGVAASESSGSNLVNS